VFRVRRGSNARTLSEVLFMLRAALPNVTDHEPGAGWFRNGGVVAGFGALACIC